LKTNPDDPQTRETLLLFYRQSGDKVFGWNEMIERRLPHLLWSIEHQPEGEVGYTKVSASADPVGYSAGKKAWLAEVDKAGASAETFRRAASFVREREPRLAEQVLLRGKERHPDDRPRTVNGVYYASLSVALGELYGQIINGQFRRQAVSEFEVDAQHATERLEQSSDPALLVGAGRQLIRTAGRVRENARLTSLGRQLIERAFKLNEDFEGADSARQYLRSREEAKPDSDLIERVWKQQVALAEPSVASRVRPGDVFWLSKLDKREKLQFWELGLGAVDSLPLEDQLRWLVLDTQRKYMQAENWYKSFDTDYMKSLDDLSMKSAMKTLEVARTAANSRQRGDGIYYANVVLALVTFHGGDRRGAVRYMRDASEAPALSDREARSGMTGVDQRLAHYLLKEGERESVAEFYEAVARLKPPSRERLLKAAAAVRDGRMPENYQRVMWNQ
jgi:hypothetical protein